MISIKNPFAGDAKGSWTRKHWALVKDQAREEDFPLIVADCVRHIEEHGLDVEGILRVSGSLSRVQELKRAYDRGRASRDFTGEPIHNVAALLKHYFKEAPEPLLGSARYDAWFQTAGLLKTPEKATTRLKELIAELDPVQQRVFHRMMLFLEKVAEHENNNKMGRNNLAVMFAPLFLRSAKAQNAHEILEDNKALVDVLLFVLTRQKEVFADVLGAGKKKAEEPEEVVRIRKAFNESLRFSGFVPGEDPLFIPVSWVDVGNRALDEDDEVLQAHFFEETTADNLVMVEEGKTKEIQRVSVSKIVAMATASNDASLKELQKNLVSVYKIFFSKHEFFLLLSLRYVGPDEKADRKLYKEFKKIRERIHAGVAQVFRFWVESSPQDFFDEALFKRFEKFFYAEINSQYTSYAPAAHINQSFDALSKWLKGQHHLESPQPPRSSAGARLPSLSASDLAEQLTVTEFKQVSQITPDELLNMSWMREDRTHRAPNLSAYIAYFFRTSRLFTTEIVKCTDLESRVAVVEAMIKIAHKCRDLRNYGTVMQILLSLYSSPVARLKTTWNGVPPKLLLQLEQLTKLMSPANEFGEYHVAVKSIKAPYVPYLGAELPVFAGIDQSNPNFIEQPKHMLNFDKARKMLEAISRFYAFKAKAYSLDNTNKDTKEFLATAESWQSNELIQIAILREGASDPKDKKKKAETKEDVHPAFLPEYDTKPIFAKGKEMKLPKGRVLTQQELGAASGLWMVRNHGRVVVNLKPGGARGGRQAEDESSSSATRESSAAPSNDVSDDDDSGSSDEEDTKKKAPVYAGRLFGKRDKKGHYYWVDKGDFFGDLALISRWNKNQPEQFRSTEAAEVQVIYAEEIALYQQIAASPALARRVYRRLGLKLAAYVYDTPIPRPAKDSRRRGQSSSKKDKDRSASSKSDNSFDIKGPKEFSCKLRGVLAQLGTLRISSTTLTFYSRTFGYESKVLLAVHPSVIKEVKSEDGDLIVTTPEKEYVFEFASPMAVEATVSVLDLHLKHGKESESAPPTDGTKELPKSIGQLLTSNDWELIVKGINVQQYDKGEYIVREGYYYDKLFQLASGVVHIYKNQKRINRDKPAYLVGEIAAPASFGEPLFLSWKPARASLVAAEKCEVYVIEGYYIMALLDIKHGLASRFYQWLAEVLAERVDSTVRHKACY